jgi:hypothetical protein
MSAPNLDQCPSCAGPSPYGRRCPACGFGNWEPAHNGNGDRIAGRAEAVMVRQGFTLTPSETRAGNVDLAFPSKPDEATRSELKACGFKWSRFNACWYGSASKLPARYGTTPFEDAPVRDPAEDAADRWNESQA